KMVFTITTAHKEVITEHLAAKEIAGREHESDVTIECELSNDRRPIHHLQCKFTHGSGTIEGYEILAEPHVEISKLHVFHVSVEDRRRVACLEVAPTERELNGVLQVWVENIPGCVQAERLYVDFASISLAGMEEGVA